MTTDPGYVGIVLGMIWMKNDWHDNTEVKDKAKAENDIW